MVQAVLGSLALALTGGLLPNYTTSEAGNPFVDGWYADPDVGFYEGQYWVYPTRSYKYEQQLSFDAFSSPDLVHWTIHENILNTTSVKWVQKALWAPATAKKGDKYYLYFAANDIQEKEPTVVGGIGVAVADRPEGPYVDAIGSPLIGAYHNGAQPIDQSVFIDDDGQAYIYYGGHSHQNVALLNPDMISLGTFPDGTQFRETTPPGFVEASLMIKRKGTYYLMWSSGQWGESNYAVNYATSSSPTGPFSPPTRVLQNDPAVAKGPGSHGVLNVPGTDIWYIVYHRRPLSEFDENHRVLAYDRLYFDDAGAMQPVTMLVHDNFADGRLPGWNVYGGIFGVVDGQLSAQASTHQDAGLALLDTNFADLMFDAEVVVTSGTGSAGLAFWARSSTTIGGQLSDPLAWNGLYVGLSPGEGKVIVESYSRGFGDATGNVTRLHDAKASLELRCPYHLRVRASVDGRVDVWVDDLTQVATTADLGVASSSSLDRTGKNGVFVKGASALFGNVSVAHPPAAVSTGSTGPIGPIGPIGPTVPTVPNAPTV